MAGCPDYADDDTVTVIEFDDCGGFPGGGETSEVVEFDDCGGFPAEADGVVVAEYDEDGCCCGTGCGPQYPGGRLVACVTGTYPVEPTDIYYDPAGAGGNGWWVGTSASGHTLILSVYPQFAGDRCSFFANNKDWPPCPDVTYAVGAPLSVHPFRWATAGTSSPGPGCDSPGLSTFHAYEPTDPDPPCGGSPLMMAAAPPAEAVLPEDTYVTARMLAADALALAARLPPDADAVVGVSRSGLVPAGLVSYARHLPLWSVSRSAGVTWPGAGGRMGHPAEPDRAAARHVLLIDDTAALGGEMRANAPAVAAAFPNARVTRAVVYAHPRGRPHVDYCHAVYAGTHYLEWNWANAGHGQGCGFDMDGLICEDCPPADDDDGQRYARFLRDARPLHLPRRAVVPLVVTARHERYRAETLGWLARHGVRVSRLVMRDFDRPAAEGWVEAIAAFKAGHHRASGLRLFAESDPAQAARIAALSGGPVLCPAAGRVFRPPVLTLADVPCPHRGPLLSRCVSCGGLKPERDTYACDHPAADWTRCVPVPARDVEFTDRDRGGDVRSCRRCPLRPAPGGGG